MLVELFLDALAAVITSVMFLLPDLDIEQWTPELSSLAGLLADGLATGDQFFFVFENLIFLRWAISLWLPVYLLFITARWLWSHLPFV